MNVPTVSVVIPCYNGSPFLPATLDSVLAQTHSPMEVIVVDDGSTDDSAAIAASYGNPVRVIRQKNQGESVARNLGMDQARGDWVAFLDADDLWNPRKLQAQVDLVEPGVVCVHTPYRTFGVLEGVCDRGHVAEKYRYTPEYVCTRPFITPSSAMVRSGIKSRFPTWAQYGEDTVFFLDLLTEGAFRMVEEPLTEIRRHSRNQSGKQAVEIEWHQTMLKWLETSAGHLSDEQRVTIHRGWQSRLIRATWRARWHGRRDEYDRYRDYMGPARDFWKGSAALAVFALRSRLWGGVFRSRPRSRTNKS
ncbi:MAG: glycosyltransferase family 2 protein [Planctomycetota bacterium]